MAPEQRAKSNCPCCGNCTLDGQPGHYDICAVYYWEDDPLQRNDPAMEGGANVVSLRAARENYRNFGACERAFVGLTRPPRDSEKTEGANNAELEKS